MNLLKIIFMNLFLSLFIFGCATTHRTYPVADSLAPDIRAKISRIASLSLLGDKIELKHKGTIVFKLSYQNVEWEIDQFVDELIRNEVSENTKYQYIDLAFAKNKLTDREERKIYDSETQMPLVNLDFRNMEDYLKSISSQYNVDTLILITRGRIDKSLNPNYPYYSDPQHINGYSLYTGSFLSVLKKPPEIFLIANMDVIDLRSMQNMVFKSIYASKKNYDNSIKKDFGELLIPEQEYCEKTLKDILREKISLALMELNLTLDYTNGINKNEASKLARENLPKHLFNCKMTSPTDTGDTWQINIMWCSTGPLYERVKEEDIPTILIDKKNGDLRLNYKQ